MSERAHWPNQFAFILAAIGSAAGLGSLWRFPYLAYKYGGGSFLLVMLFAYIIMGVPLLILEVGLGQMTQHGGPDAFDKVRRGGRYIGWFALAVCFTILTYYMSVMGWGIDYLVASFSQAWGADPKAYFFNEILQITDGPGIIGGISWPVLTGVLIAWVAIYFCVWKGVNSVSKVVMVTATLPFLILFILIIRAVTLDGAMDGLKLFLIPNLAQLANPRLWISAFSQVFFILSLATGVMIAYGSFNHPKSEITKSVFWISFGTFMTSFMSGLVVFGTLGYLAHEQGVPLVEAMANGSIAASGPGLAFVTFPQIIALLPGLNTLFAVIFFTMLLMLGIDSAFSLLEGVATSFKDRYPKVSSPKIVALVSLVGMIVGLLFTTKAGLYYLDIVDHFVVNYGLVMVGMLESILIGWMWKSSDLVEYINKYSEWKIGQAWLISIRFIIPGFLLFLIGWNIVTEVTTPYEGYPTWALIWLGLVLVVALPIIGAIIDWITFDKKHLKEVEAKKMAS